MKISTFFILFGMLIISLYGLIEISYYSSANQFITDNTNIPYLEIPKIDVNQPINNKSVDYGIYHDLKSAKPGLGTIALFGHRTLHGSSFLNLDKLQPGDNITIKWPGIGNVEYEVINSTIVQASYKLSVEQGNTLFLATCYPFGTSNERLMIRATQVHIYPLNMSNKKIDNNPQYALIIILAFFIGGIIISSIYPVKEEQHIIFLATIIITLFLIITYIYPIPPTAIESKLSLINKIIGV
ncbi:MAG: class E sortase [Methanobacterium sp.]|nr:class E sortase [Methanobacterium sp.]